MIKSGTTDAEGFDINSLLDTLDTLPTTPPPTPYLSNTLDMIGETLIRFMPFLGSDTNPRQEKNIGIAALSLVALLFVLPMLKPKKKTRRRRRVMKKRAYAPRRRRTYKRRK